MEIQLSTQLFHVQVEPKGPTWGFRSSIWPGLQAGPLTCRLRINDQSHGPTKVQVEQGEASHRNILRLTWTFPQAYAQLVQTVVPNSKGWLHLQSQLTNLSTETLCLNEVALLESEKPGQIVFGKEQERARVYEDGGYWGRVRPLSRPVTSAAERVEQVPGGESIGTSQVCWEIYNLADRMALLVGYTTFERWLGTVKTRYTPAIGIAEWLVGFDAGDLLVDPGQTLLLEEIVLMLGRDPWRLLEEFGDLVKEKYNIKPLRKAPVSWCSWYPYRLGVTEERVLANATAAMHLLKPLGLSNMELDLGWEKGYLPSAYQENEQFPHGLKWLAERLAKLGFNLGVWKAPFTISEFDPIAHEHPEWLLGDAKEKPTAYWTWFWKPHGKVYALDLTHPKAREYLHEKITSLTQRGAKYFKFDFIGGPCNPHLRNRHNPKMIAGGGIEAVRLGSKIIAEALKAADPQCIVLNCNPYEVCGLGYFDLLYTCSDTGNTGYLPWSFMKENYTSVACHLWKNHRWGIIEPSCLCVGLPGTLEEARVRATATFLSGGEVDISDDLTTLPEDRWQVLLSILPPPEASAKPIDLFEPVTMEKLSYEDMCRGLEEGPTDQFEQEGASVWLLPVNTEWDKWILVGLFAWDLPTRKSGKKDYQITRFSIPWERLGLDPKKNHWIYEFWSGQFLGETPSTSEPPKGYTHPGDARTLLWGTTKDRLQVAFFGPAVKLLVIRETRPHPWIVGTSFHISGGTELKSVAWDEAKGELSCELHRPVGQRGFIVVAGLNGRSGTATVAGRPVPTRPGANGSVVIPIVTEKDVISVKFNSESPI